jgi:integrase
MEASYKIHEVTLGQKARTPAGYKGWLISGHDENGKRYRKAFRSYTKAKEHLEKLISDLETDENDTSRFQRFTWLTQEQVSFAENAFKKLNDPDPRFLIEAVENFLANREKLESQKDADLLASIDEFIKAKEASGKSEEYTKPMKYRLKDFAGTKKIRICDVTSMQISDHLIKFKDLESKKSVRKNLHTFFNWSVQQGYASENPVRKTEKIKKVTKLPKILTFNEASQMLDFAKIYRGGSLLPYTVLSLFCGLRPNEARRLTWGDINFDEKFIRVHKTKVSQVRLAVIPEIASKLLQTCKNKEIAPGRKALERLKNAGGYTSDGKETLKKWVPDIFRHTCLSYHCTTHSVEDTARWSGTSVAMIHNHYRGLVTPIEASKYWSL